MDDARLVLIGRRGCHLCEEAREVVARVAADLDVAWVERDVDDDPELVRQYSDLVPVVLVDGRRHAYWQVEEDRLRTALASGDGHSWLARWRD